MGISTYAGDDIGPNQDARRLRGRALSGVSTASGLVGTRDFATLLAERDASYHEKVFFLFGAGASAMTRWEMHRGDGSTPAASLAQSPAQRHPSVD